MQTFFGPVKFYAYEDFKRQNSVNTPELQIIEQINITAIDLNGFPGTYWEKSPDCNTVADL